MTRVIIIMYRFKNEIEKTKQTKIIREKTLNLAA